ncbi:MAG: Putative inner membrane protein [Burkholderiaceae bacterium]|jgi:Mlc titration factor MtfA (ptsG expression regulator)|nr:MAG: Putative inner membrane protein [Burkholderiaceae bacterium]
MRIPRIWSWLRKPARTIPEGLWQHTLARYPFLAQLNEPERSRLRQLTGRFLDQKEFHGAHGLRITDQIAVAIAAQACLPLLHIDARGQALRWYRDFVGIVVHSHEVVAQREITDPAGIVHRYREVLSGEAMDKGPVMVNWHDVKHAGSLANQGYNVVIHEFIHKIDMQDSRADGCPPLPAGFMGTRGPRAARRLWFTTLRPAYDAFREQTIQAERFGGPRAWLNSYGATSIVEFLAVSCEAYFVNRNRFQQEFPALVPLYDAFFRRDPAVR